MALFSLRKLMERQGVKRKTVKLRPIHAAPADVARLRSIGNDMVALVYGFAEELAQAAKPVANPLSHMIADEAGIDGVALVIMDSGEDIDRLLNLVVTQTQNVMARLQFRVRDWSAKTEARHRAQFTETVFARTKVNLSTILHPSQVDQTVEHYTTWATSLIRNIGEEARQKIGHAVLDAVRNSTAPSELIRTIREYEDMSYRRAKNIAGDQTTKLNAALDRARQQEVGISAFTWIHSGSPHPREEHLARDGELFLWDDNDIDAGDYPGEPPFCGCVAQATLVDESGNELAGAASDQEGD